MALVAFAEEHLPLILAGSAAWEDLAEYGPPYWRPRSIAELRRKLSAMAGPAPAVEYNFVIEVDESIVGEGSVHTIDYRNRAAQLGVCIWNPADRGHGHGSVALQQLITWACGYLGLYRLEGWIVGGNDASVAMVTRAGFTYEGTLRERYLCNGRRRDMHVYAYLTES